MPKARSLEVPNSQRECPECGYQNGFHVSFHRTPPDERGNDVQIRLICPSCSAVYDIGLKARLSHPS